ncbi:MAG: ABC transporter ATP-binding protein [Chloroflexi bacterium]|nr:ABC transporter ATP-binding protein [Chloroflexota bacterium]
MPVLEVKDLTVEYATARGPVHAATGVTFTLAEGDSMGLVGESGCGKTTVALSLMRVLADNATIVRGHVWLDGVDLTELPEPVMAKQRWSKISMVFQAAMNSLDPVHRVSDQIVEAIEFHEDVSRADAFARARSLFGAVGLDENMLRRYPHEYSGGMRQRAVIAMALACNPRVIVADEPTTALDVLVQDRILDQLREIQARLRMAMIYISHDVAVIAEVTSTVGVMYAGRIVEKGPTRDVFVTPIHPYTEALLGSVPSARGPKKPLRTLAGDPPDLISLPPGCPFAPRCPNALERCRVEDPPMVGSEGHWALCWNPVRPVEPVSPAAPVKTLTMTRE